VCAPLSSVDLATPDGGAIPIEERAADEVLVIRGERIAPAGTAVRNPAFDVTPAELISAIVTDEGALRPPFAAALAAAADRRTARRDIAAARTGPAGAAGPAGPAAAAGASAATGAAAPAESGPV
jgi:hypothetical protein